MKSFMFTSRRRHTRLQGDWSSDVCSTDLTPPPTAGGVTTLQALAILKQPGWEKWDAERFDTRRACLEALRLAWEIGRASCRERLSSWESGTNGKDRSTSRMTARPSVSRK